MTGQQPDIIWKSGVPVSSKFDDPYFSLEDGVAETQHVFIEGNALPSRLKAGMHIAELGFGTGLNLLVLLRAARAAGVMGQIRYTGFEAYPMTPRQMAESLKAFPEFAEDARWLTNAWRQGPVFETNEIAARIVLGDARDTLPGWAEKADAWFLDGFAPARNAELWEPALLAQIAQRTTPNGTAATYTAAGQVRRDLEAAGFEVSRVPGYGRKRHMTTARLR